MEEELQHTDKHSKWVDYLHKKASCPEKDKSFMQQMDRLVSIVESLGRDITAESKKQAEQTINLGRLHTRMAQWKPLCAHTPALQVAINLNDSKIASSNVAEQLEFLQSNVPHGTPWALLSAPNATVKCWKLYLHNGRDLVVAGQALDEVPKEDGWDFRSLLSSLKAQGKPGLEKQTVMQKIVSDFCKAELQNQQQKIQDLEQRKKTSQECLQVLDQQRQTIAHNTHKKEKTCAELKDDDPSFLLPLFDDELRQKVVSQLVWSKFPEGHGLRQVLRLLTLGKLRELNLQDCKELTYERVIDLARYSPELTTLNISGCKQLTHDAVVALATHCKYLQNLSAANLSKVTDLWQGWRWASSEPLVFPLLTHANFRGCNKLYRVKSIFYIIGSNLVSG